MGVLAPATASVAAVRVAPVHVCVDCCGRVEHHVVVDLVLAAAIPAAAEARYSLGLVVRRQMNLCAEESLGLPADAEAKSGGDIDRDVRLLRGGKGIAVKADAAAAGQLDLHLIAREIGSVVADLGRPRRCAES